jgi:hypothetical protein
MSSEYHAREAHHLWVVAGRLVEAAHPGSAAEGCTVAA